MTITETAKTWPINFGRRSLYIACSLLCFAISVLPQDENARVSATWQVSRYDITATVPPSEADRNLVATAKLDLKNVSSRAASTLTLRISSSAEITTVSVNGTRADFTKGEEKVGTGALQRIVIRIPGVPPGGTLPVTVEYKLNVK